MRALGSPADLISNVGGGVKALIYAPAQGLVQGPAEFFEGVSRGAHSFVKGWIPCVVPGNTSDVAAVCCGMLGFWPRLSHVLGATPLPPLHVRCLRLKVLCMGF